MKSMACNGSFGNAPLRLASWLLAADYSAHARARIVSYAIAEGTLTGCPELDHEHEAVATEVFVESLPAVSQTSPAWEDPMEWTLPAQELEAIDAENFADECNRRDAVDPPPIRGGAPRFPSFSE